MNSETMSKVITKMKKTEIALNEIHQLDIFCEENLCS